MCVVPCRLALFTIFNAYPDHDKQENWERRCVCVSYLCGCTEEVKKENDGKYVLCLCQLLLTVLKPCMPGMLDCSAFVFLRRDLGTKARSKLFTPAHVLTGVCENLLWSSSRVDR